MTRTRFLIADDQEIVQLGLRALIEQEAGWEVCATTGSGRTAVTLAETHRPDIVISELILPELSGLETIRRIKRLLPDTEVLVFTAEEPEEVVRDIFQAGAKSFISKADPIDSLRSGLAALVEHKTFFTAKISNLLFSRFMAGEKSSEAKGPLSSRESEITHLLAEGNTNKEVASALGISVKTVEKHRETIMRKLGTRSFSDVIRYAIRHKMIRA
jgi:DNA-binding NarL/FixJ family response regulator